MTRKYSLVKIQSVLLFERIVEKPIQKKQTDNRDPYDCYSCTFQQKSAPIISRCDNVYLLLI